MQQKEFEYSKLQVIPVTTGVDSLIIENTGLSKLNFHGIRYCGRIIVDPSIAADTFGAGFISLMCIPNDQIAIPSLLTEADLNDSNSFIIAVVPWSCHHQAAADNHGGYQTVFDFDIAPKTSRSCMKGGKIVGQITNSSGIQAIVTHMLSSFETF